MGSFLSQSHEWPALPTQKPLFFSYKRAVKCFFSLLVGILPIILAAQAEVVQSLLLCPPLIPASTAACGVKQVSELEVLLLPASPACPCLAFSAWFSHCFCCYHSRRFVLLTVTTQATFSLKRIKHSIPWRLHQSFIYFLCFVLCIMKYSVGG